MKSMRIPVAAIACVLLAALSGCARQGPSDEKIRADLDDWIRERSRGVFVVGGISVEERNRIAEDRFEYRGSMTLKVVNESLLASRVSGLLKDAKAGRGDLDITGLVEQPALFFLRYKKKGEDFWEIDRIRIEDGRR